MNDYQIYAEEFSVKQCADKVPQFKLFMTMFTPLKTSITKYIFRYSFMIIIYLFGQVLRKVAEAEI